MFLLLLLESSRPSLIDLLPIALLPFGNPGPHGDQNKFFGPHFFLQSPHFLHFRLKNTSKMQMIGLEKYKNSFGRNPALLQNKRWYHLSANADGWVWQMQSGQTSKSRYLQCANTYAWFWQIHEGPPYWCHLCDMANAYMLECSFIQIITHIAKMWWTTGGVLVVYWVSHSY